MSVRDFGFSGFCENALKFIYFGDGNLAHPPLQSFKNDINFLSWQILSTKEQFIIYFHFLRGRKHKHSNICSKDM
jgi:hypothetical protein